MGEETQTQPTTENTGTRNKSESNSLIEQANNAAERLEAANKRSEELVKRNEQIVAEMRLGGRTFAGQANTKTPEQEAEEIMNAEVERTLKRFR
jgi:hypothetical protein